MSNGNESTIAAINESVVLLTPDGPRDGTIVSRHSDGTVTIQLPATTTMPTLFIRAEAVSIYRSVDPEMT